MFARITTETDELIEVDGVVELYIGGKSIPVDPECENIVEIKSQYIGDRDPEEYQSRCAAVCTFHDFILHCSLQYGHEGYHEA